MKYKSTMITPALHTLQTACTAHGYMTDKQFARLLCQVVNETQNSHLCLDGAYVILERKTRFFGDVLTARIEP